MAFMEMRSVGDWDRLASRKCSRRRRARQNAYVERLIIWTLHRTRSIRSRFAIATHRSSRPRTRTRDKATFRGADLIRMAGNRFIERYGGSLTWVKLKV